MRGPRGRERPRRRGLALLLAVALAVVGCRADAVDPGAADPGAGGPEPERTVAAPDEPDDAPVPPAPSPAVSPTPVDDDTPPPPPPTRDALVERLQALVDAAVEETQRGQLAVLVTDAYGRELAAHRPDEPVLPASTLKVVTAAAVLSTVGADLRLPTRVETTAPIDAEGTIAGDLVLVGSGDPTLVTDEYARWIYPARPRTRLAELADALVDAGLRRVDGGVLGVAEGFTGPTTAQGWLDRYFSDLDARHIAGLTVDGGLVTTIRWPTLDEQARERAAQDAEEGDDPEPVEPVRVPLVGSSEEIEQRLAGLDPPLARVDHATDPVAHAARELARMLEERGVEVRGESGAADPHARPSAVGRLATVHSPPMAEVLRFAVQRSDNHLTDHLFHLIGRLRTGEGSWERGERALQQTLDRFGVDRTGARFADGSGLSRDDRVTARLLVDLDRVMTDGRHGSTWASLMAVTGESGTLRQRLRGTPAAGRFLGKTGTLRDVTSLSGAVVGDDGDRYHLAVLANEADGADRWVARALMDELILALVAEVQGCAIAPAAGAEAGPLGVPPSVVAC
jgi:D-alanyl-D-alanine carboxypeptidase/D-alanyl-D-alanine-endopeptidase (penicillin-binding protein 4)